MRSWLDPFRVILIFHVKKMLNCVTLRNSNCALVSVKFDSQPVGVSTANTIKSTSLHNVKRYNV